MYSVYYEFDNKEAHVGKITNMSEFNAFYSKLQDECRDEGTTIVELRIKREI